MNIRKTISIILLLISLLSCGQSETKEYSVFIQEIQTKRNEYKILFDNSDSIEKKSIIIKARHYIFNTITSDLFSYWYGTPWDFNGTTTIPKQGSIACGFFVTTIIKDAGFNIPRVKWAQMAAEPVIKKLAKNDIKRFSNKPIEDVEKYLTKNGDGLYVVGLDCHVGFIVVKNGKIKFIHSNYYQPETGVMSENIDTENPLKNSGYRIVGKLLSDEMIIHWIQNEALE